MLYSLSEIGESFFFEPKAWYEAFYAMHPVELQGVKEMLNLRSFPPNTNVWVSESLYLSIVFLYPDSFFLNGLYKVNPFP